MTLSLNSPDSPIEVTDRAITRVQQIGAAEGQDSPRLRVYIEGGGCSGFQYGFALEKDADGGDSDESGEAAGDDDIEIGSDGVTVVVDPMSLQYLMGSKIDYRDDLMGARFVVSNPNAQTTCGCGSSFSI